MKSWRNINRKLTLHQVFIVPLAQMCAVHSYRCRRKQVSCAACGLPYALGFRCFWVSPDCAIFWYISQKGLKTGQKQPKIAVFRGDNPLRIAYLTATRPLVRNLRNMARIFGDFKILLYLCSISEGNDGMLMFLIMRNGGGFHRSFWAAAVGSRD